MNLESYIEAILFFKGEPVSVKQIAGFLEKSEDEIRLGLTNLEKSLENRGIRLIFKDDEVSLVTFKEASDIIAKIRKEELNRDLGKAGLETLSIIAYMGPISKKEVDYIRGVNSNFIIRNLLIRGLIEKVQGDKDQRVFLYKPTFDLLSFLGIEKIEDLPEYQTAKEEIEKFKNLQEAENVEEK